MTYADERVKTAHEAWLYCKEEPEERRWKPITATESARKQAIRQGSMYFTWCRFSEQIGTNSAQEPNRWGDFPIDTDDKDHMQNALDDIRRLCLDHLPKLYGVDPYSIRFFATGGKGFHGEIPAELFGATDGDPYLHLIYKKIACDWATRFDLPTSDLSLFAGGMGKMWRIPNVRRSNGRYKVPLTLEEARDLPIEALMDLTRAPRTIEPVEADLTPNEDLSRLYQEARTAVYSELEERQDASPLTEEERQLLGQRVPPCIKYILAEMPAKSERVNFNKLVVLLGTYFHMARYDKDTAWTQVERFIDRYPHSETYDTPAKRVKAWHAQWQYLAGNERYQFACSYVLGLKLPGKAFSCKDCDKIQDHKSDQVSQGYTAAELVTLEFPEPTWIVPGMIPDGFGILVGKPKTGKSWLALLFAIMLPLGRAIFDREPAGKGNVLYLALEDTPRRLKRRLLAMLRGAPPPEGLQFFTSWPRIDDSGIENLVAWLTSHPQTRLVIIDTLAKIRSSKSKKSEGQTLYDHDYAAVGNLKRVADEFNICVLVVHHLRKGATEDPVEQISGSMGISGAADTVLILQRTRGKADATLLVTGRDIEEAEFALQFDKATCAWQLLGDAETYKRSQEQLEVLEIIKEAKGPLDLKEILTLSGKERRNCGKLLNSLIQDGLVVRVGRGKYSLLNSSYSTYGSHSIQGSYSSHPAEWELEQENRNSCDTGVVPIQSSMHQGLTGDRNYGNYGNRSGIRVKCADCIRLAGTTCADGRSTAHGIYILHECARFIRKGADGIAPEAN